MYIIGSQAPIVWPFQVLSENRLKNCKLFRSILDKQSKHTRHLIEIINPSLCYLHVCWMVMKVAITSETRSENELVSETNFKDGDWRVLRSRGGRYKPVKRTMWIRLFLQLKGPGGCSAGNWDARECVFSNALTGREAFWAQSLLTACFTARWMQCIVISTISFKSP